MIKFGDNRRLVVSFHGCFYPKCASGNRTTNPGGADAVLQVASTYIAVAGFQFAYRLTHSEGYTVLLILHHKLNQDDTRQTGSSRWPPESGSSERASRAARREVTSPLGLQSGGP